MTLDLHPHVDEGRRRYRKGCRCVVCKAAVAEYQRVRRQHQESGPSTTMAPGNAGNGVSAETAR